MNSVVPKLFGVEEEGKVRKYCAIRQEAEGPRCVL